MDTTNAHKHNENANKTYAILWTTGGRDEPNIVFPFKSERTSYHGTQNVKTHNMTAQKTKKISNRDPDKKPGVNSGAREG
jgi:hypothetical protein